ncbi:putative protein without homology [Propionibacterium freudenreichii subsp. shermanii]|nr:putative protein without homology [Propionibacterium freudenreichii subsp. shermanii]
MWEEGRGRLEGWRRLFGRPLGRTVGRGLGTPGCGVVGRLGDAHGRSFATGRHVQLRSS